MPVGWIVCSTDGSRIEPWTPAVGYEGLDGLGKAADGGIYKSKIEPLAPYSVRGVPWYQGESNLMRGETDLYTRRMEALVGGWRKVWHQPAPKESGALGGDFPFYFVKIAPYDYVKHKKCAPDALPRFWEAQGKAQAIPYTGMAVITDVGEIDNIHPGKIEEVGRRVALLALARTYGQNNLVSSGPVYKSVAVDGGKVRLKIERVGGGLASRDGKPLEGFEVAGDDKKFVQAATEIDGESVVVSVDAVAKPVAVRFNWRPNVVPNLINKDGRPAAPFRTDNW